jgi:pilus assembly protein Flp/PilA
MQQGDCWVHYEHGLIAALIAVAAIAALGAVGTNLTSTFTTVGNNL